MGKIIFCDDQKPGGILINAVNDPGAKLASNAGKILDMVHKGIDKGSVWVACRRMNDHTDGLVYHGDVGVLINDVKRNGFGCQLGFMGFGKPNLYCIGLVVRPFTVMKPSEISL